MANKPRFRRSIVLLGSVVVAMAGTVWWNNHQSIAMHRWFAEASKGHRLMAAVDTVCIVPAFKGNDTLRQFLGRRQVIVAVFNSEDADKLLAMPDCPAKLVVKTIASTPPEVVTRLRERFGSAME